MLAVVLSLLALAANPESTSAPGAAGQGESVQSMLHEESPDVFLAKATLQQYLERVTRKDWNGVRRLTHPKALIAIDARSRRGEADDLAAWDADDELGPFALKAARSAGPGRVLVEVTERGQVATYIVFKSRGSWLVGAKEFGARLGDLPDEWIRSRYPGWVDHQALTQARRPERATRRPERKTARRQ